MSRRPHSKSRNGCAQCKRRRVKCDVAKPVCTNCERRGEACEYYDLVVQHADGRRSWSSLSQSSDTSIQDTYYNPGPTGPNAADAAAPARPAAEGAVGNADDDLNMRHMELMHHWTSVVAPTLTSPDEPEKAILWRDLIPAIGQTNDFVMRELLAFSACHIALTATDPVRLDIYMELGRRHHDLAAQLFQQIDRGRAQRSAPAPGSVAAVPPFRTEAVPLYIIMSVLTVRVLIRPTNKARHDLDTWIAWLLQLRESMKQIVAYCMTQAPQLLDPKSPVAGLLSHMHQGPEKLMDPAPGLVASLDRVEAASRAAPDASAVDKEHISLAVQQTKVWSRLVRPGSYMYQITWIMTVSDDYARLLQARQPAALAVMAHWLTYECMVKRQPWFNDDWHFRALAATLHELGSAWRPVLVWVTDQVDVYQIRFDEGSGGTQAA